MYRRHCYEAFLSLGMVFKIIASLVATIENVELTHIDVSNQSFRVIQSQLLKHHKSDTVIVVMITLIEVSYLSSLYSNNYVENRKKLEFC